MAVDKFEDLVAWQKARELTRGIYEVTRRAAFKQDQALMKQLQRASVSVMSNLAEGFERGDARSFITSPSLQKDRVQKFAANSTLLMMLAISRLKSSPDSWRWQKKRLA